MQRVVLASSNRGKLAEFNALLADSGFEVVAQSSLGIADAEETGLSFVENALLKARHAARASGLPALADDSGLCVAHLRGAPGLYSARYAGGHGDSAANNAKLLRTLDGVPAAQRDAFFICALALLQDADDPAPLIAEGRWHGRVLDAPRGAKGFGYDPLFLPHGQALSAAELEPALKNRLSHRGQALALLHERLSELRHA
ncbi:MULTISPECIES: RdgB/HAM1 family non-canonical purine NTP pyrophosphatase [unclassified Rhodanobacter]|uniref:RdgB/HAM1 family non-canonical purine NTP pyrophosphatase n=1 Tax=unclassified Rhodanobacter TaxID=2621553 RepID=UPI001BE058DB|nr:MULTISPECIES: RdgB/HAM1 family non-canonical purine NTP pyrophosphatase [unclassified Rhodanobacter]MBT2143573.1 RdgB/HAM1 family non-canonical purine NTP pyrophosphatase [Rhodanobacter sp. LX-99]MBT2147353.1 RdgB/HAM1 family non-canonical purine NTP pyrophosphatase [Rhodanobacter sp. LX-100]